MKHPPTTISRRRLLGALGTIGGAAAVGGAGTMAFFADEEEFTNNELVAGELDLMVDWQEHYSDWSTDENDDRTDDAVLGPLETAEDEDESDEDLDGDGVDDFEVLMTEGDPTNVPDGYTGFPVPMEPLIAVEDKFVDDLMANTAIEAFPDSDDNGIQDTIYTRNQLSTLCMCSGEELEEKFRSQFANLDAGLSSDARTNGTIGGPPNPQTTNPGDPLIDISDLKPGDFGEVTLSVHLFNNPAYLWLVGGLRANDENGYTDPERTDEDEDLSGPNARGELMDAIKTAVWHDNGDNILGEDGEDGGGAENLDSPHDSTGSTSITVSQSEALIFEGSLRELLAELASGGIPLDHDPTTTERDCFPRSTTRYFALAWWLPVDHANEIQSDRVAFDVGFYTEQCRHNDGAGQRRDDGGATAPSTVDVSATETSVDVTTRHRIEVTVGDDLDGSTLNELVVDYPSDFDISNVGQEDVVNSGVEQSGGGAVGADVSNVDGSDNGTTLTVTYSNSAGLSKGDTVFLEYEDAQNASSDGTYTVDVAVNGIDVGSDTLTITTP